MTTYLLLRNNKQSGPYSLEELKSMGLKAYDLVWLEGRSAAWRYPCEIEELSAFAPAVEEQPFDRFFKKPSSTTAVADQTATWTTAAPASAFAPSPVAEAPDEPVRAPGKRIIYVTMPASRAAAPLRETTTTTAQSALSPAPPASAASRRTAVAPIPDYTVEPVEEMPANIGYSSYAKRHEPRPARAIVRYLVVGVTILALLAAGIFIGLSLNKSSLGIQPKVVAKVPPGDNGRSIVHTTAQTLPAATPPAVARNKTDSPAVVFNKPVDTKRHRSSTVKQKERPSQSLSEAALPAMGKDSPITEPPVAHHDALHGEALHRSDATNETNPANPDREAVRTALASQVIVGANSYSVGAFGGINNLQLTVTNRSTYPLDLVIVEVQYVQANKKIFKTENLYFHSIGAGSALMQEAPRSSRGVKVQYRITAISSRELGLSYSGI